MNNEVVKAHIIDDTSGAVIAKTMMRAVPRVGDEVRLAGERYYKVTLVVWCLDETDHPFADRVNIGVEAVAPT